MLLLLPGPAPAGDCCANTGGKAILLMAFGTNVEQARQIYAKITEATKACFPGLPLRWAYTSHQIRQKLAQEGSPVLSPAQALANLAEDGFTRVAVLSLSIIPGAEFAALEDTAQRFSGMPKVLQRVTLGQPLLASSADIQRVAQALLASAPP